jgi:hypothetical protein
MHITRIVISELPFVIDESCVIKLNSDNRVDSIEHHLNDTFVLNREVEFSPHIGLKFDTSLANIDIAVSINLAVANKEVPYSGKNVESKLKRNV